MTLPDTARLVSKCTLGCVTHGAVNTETSVLITTILNDGDHPAEISAFDAEKREGLYGPLLEMRGRQSPYRHFNVALTS